MNTVEIVYFETTKVAAIEHRGSPDTTYDTTRKFIEWRRANGVSPISSRTFGIHYDDHETVRPEEYRIDICASIDFDVKPNPEGVVMKVIPGGRVRANSSHRISREHQQRPIPISGVVARKRQVHARCSDFFQYVNVGSDVRDHEMITDVYLPLCERSGADCGRNAYRTSL